MSEQEKIGSKNKIPRWYEQDHSYNNPAYDECPHCEGYGYFEVDLDCGYDCHKCGGTGYVQGGKQ